MSNYLKDVEEQLAELTEQGAHRRPRPRLDVLALAAAVAVVAAVAVALATIGQNARHHQGAASHPHFPNVNSQARQHTVRHGGTKTATAISYAVPPGGPVPAGFGPESFTAIDEFDWWLLGTAPCSSPPCTSIVRTTDGGRSFVGIPAPRTQNVSQLRFADAVNGYAYGAQLWFTPDGGFDWRQVHVSGQVTELAIGGGYVYAIVRRDGTGSLIRSAIGSDVWRTLPRVNTAFAGLWVHGSDVLLETENASTQNLAMSTDHGNHFTMGSLPPDVVCQLELPGPPVIWAHCATGMLSGTWRSVNDGASFARVGRGTPELPNSAAFGSASATTAVVGYQQLYRTDNGGASWSPSSGPSGITWWQYVGFTDPTHGVAIGYVGAEQPNNERLYYTTDGGASYHLVRIR